MQLLDLFDGANATDCYRRTDTVIPQQALALTNSEFSTTYARVLARKLWQRVINEASAAPTVVEGAFIKAAFEQVLTRRPTDAEAAACMKFLTVPVGAPNEPAAAATQPVRKAIVAGPTTSASEDPAMRARESLVHVLLNHSDFVTIR